jgi:hypothetical protein
MDAGGKASLPEVGVLMARLKEEGRLGQCSFHIFQQQRNMDVQLVMGNIATGAE